MNVQQVREDAEWLRKYERGEVDIDEADPIIAGLSCADAYLALTDPTPLTVERLVERGFKREGVWYDRGNVRVGWTDRPVKLWAWYEMLPEDERVRICPSPRTVGQLAMLELLMEGR